MIVENKKDYILFSSDKEGFKEFYNDFASNHKNYVKNNIIIDLSSKLDVDSSNIFLFLEYANLHQENGTTFVVVYSNVDIDSFPETFNIVPTLVEAEDVLEMENIQRDLGF